MHVLLPGSLCITRCVKFAAKVTGFSFWVCSNWKHQVIRWAAALLLLSGDIHLNPGPPLCLLLRMSMFCVVKLYLRQVGIKCNICNKWCHHKCAWMNDMERQRLGNSAYVWCYPACCLLSFNNSFLSLLSPLFPQLYLCPPLS